MIEGRQYACRAILALVKVRTMNILWWTELNRSLLPKCKMIMRKITIDIFQGSSHWFGHLLEDAVNGHDISTTLVPDLPYFTNSKIRARLTDETQRDKPETSQPLLILQDWGGFKTQEAIHALSQHMS
jgi:hypothetical protein